MPYKSKKQSKNYFRKYYKIHKEQYTKYQTNKVGKKQNSEQFCKNWKYYFPDVFRKLLDIQQNNCAVCGKSFKNHQIHVDHDHTTKLVRGLLCWRCNRFRVAQNRSDDIKQVNEYLLNPPAIQLQ